MFPAIVANFFGILVLVVLGITDGVKTSPLAAGLAIGLALVIIHIIIPTIGTSVNPARSIGPALFGGRKSIVSIMAIHCCSIIRALLIAGVWRLIKDEN